MTMAAFLLKKGKLFTAGIDKVPGKFAHCRASR
jgi:hypothetical protein